MNRFKLRLVIGLIAVAMPRPPSPRARSKLAPPDRFEPAHRRPHKD